MASILKRGHLQWQATIRRRGFPTVCKTFETKAEAEGWAAAEETQMRKGLWVSSKEAESTTLAECLDRYAEEALPSHKDGGRREMSRIRKLKEHPLALRFMATIRAKDIAAYRKGREKDGARPDTIRLEFGTLSRTFDRARDNWGMESLQNPVKITTKPKIPEGRKRRLIGDEEKRLKEASPHPLFTLIFELALETAMRRGEILGLQWSRINFKKRFILLEDTKNGESRLVPLSLKAIEVLKKVPRNISDTVFDLHIDTINKWMVKACKAAGIKGLRFHDLRHEATTRFFEISDMNALEVSRVTGHKSMQMLSRYTHLEITDLAARLDGVRKGDIVKTTG